jgi:putative ABC transport system substrate-binding protein
LVASDARAAIGEGGADRRSQRLTRRRTGGQLSGLPVADAREGFVEGQNLIIKYRARSLNIRLQPLKLEQPPYDFGAAFRQAIAGGAQAALILSSPFFIEQTPRIAELATAHRLPTMFTFRHYVEAGGLMSYGVDFPDMFRKTAEYVGRILKGANPADLPIEQATKFETVVNLKTAKAIGIELPTGILLRADHVVE